MRYKKKQMQDFKEYFKIYKKIPIIKLKKPQLTNMLKQAEWPVQSGEVSVWVVVCGVQT